MALDKNFIAAIRTYAAEIHKGAAPTFSFVSGSVVEGLSTPKSDVDAYFVIDADTLPVDEVASSVHGTAVELAFLRLAEVDAIIRKVNAGYGADNGLTAYQRQTAHRLLVGQCMDDDSSQFEAAKSRLDGRRLSEYLWQHHGLFAEKCFSDGIGNVLADDPQSALFNAERAANNALDALIAAHGGTSTAEKWRWANAHRTLGAAHPALVRHTELLGSIPTTSSKHAKTRYIEEVGRLVQCIGDFLISRHHFPKASFEFNPERLWGPDPTAVGARAVTKRSLARAFLHNGEVFLNDVYPHFKLSTESLAIWLSVDNRSDEKQLLKLAERVYAERKISVRRFSEVLARLRESGVVR